MEDACLPVPCVPPAVVRKRVSLTLTRYRSIRFDTHRGSSANPAMLSTISCGHGV